ncbi:hypothetical protein BK120_23155 [Paenibacillus sp. FSL A5-0031]|uniref:hypothetical protein n=1 Tax=Paenibacillus sp. FSL A5-0031 TaxID=1920420 RepID=UPI00096F8455|nr:hypothetical protein [Paenibacillus sp. FSL A5-0031]OME78640.1 hypothetical protein BK120_23155 [Paenibacillus sp. FSL A5-0031]
MGQEAKIIKELDFVLTHPACSVLNIEHFYNTCLYVYDSVPLLSIIGHMKRMSPHLLTEWSLTNLMVKNLLTDLEPDLPSNGENMRSITIRIDLSKVKAAEKGIFQIVWTTDIPDETINYHFKKKSIVVNDAVDGNVMLLGLSIIDKNKYYLYIKKRRK